MIRVGLLHVQNPPKRSAALRVDLRSQGLEILGR